MLLYDWQHRSVYSNHHKYMSKRICNNIAIATCKLMEIFKLYYNFIGPLSHMLPVTDQNVMWHMTLFQSYSLLSFCYSDDKNTLFTIVP